MYLCTNIEKDNSLCYNESAPYNEMPKAYYDALLKKILGFQQIMMN